MVFLKEYQTLVIGIITLIVLITGLFFTYRQLVSMKKARHLESFFHSSNRFEELAKDEAIVEFSCFVQNILNQAIFKEGNFVLDLIVIKKWIDEYVSEHEKEITIPEEKKEKIIREYKNKYLDNVKLEKLFNFFEELGILWKKKYFPIELVDLFFGQSIVIHWIELYPITKFRGRVSTNFEDLFWEEIKIAKKKSAKSFIWRLFGRKA